MGIKTVPQPHYCPDLVRCNFFLSPKLTGCRYETIEEMKEAVTKVLDTLTQEDFQRALQKLLERYNKCIASGGDYFEGDWSFICLLSIKVPIGKKSLETYCLHLLCNHSILHESLVMTLKKKTRKNLKIKINLETIHMD